jgi:signal transduction histidine kinase
MRTVYAKVLLWGFGTVLFSLVAFMATSFYLSRRNAGSPFLDRDKYLFDEAVRAYESGGRAALASTLARQSAHFHIELHLAGANGIDLISGQDRSALLTHPGEHRPPRKMDGRMLVVLRDPARRYAFLVFIPPPPFDYRTVAPYFVLILLAIAGLCWLLAVNIASPLRQLATTVDRFGAGDLDARIAWRRGDEIGDLAQAFNQMADRIQTLLTAERRLLQDISHELRSPLARLSFAAELTRTASDRNAAVARLRKEIDRLADLISGLIQVTRAEGEFPERNLRPVLFDRLVYDVVESCELEANARRCHIECTDRVPVKLRGDEELLRRAVENVLRNAIRYAPESSVIEVNLASNGSAAELAIRDYGPGVPDEMLPKIFTPFFRVDSSRDSTTGGVGLGLAIAQRAVLLHHGQISAANAGPGLKVTIALPLA